jgi:hypothetical protein
MSAPSPDLELPPIERGVLAAIASAVFVLLAATANQYGYHRDELYFLAAGRHLSWGYPDQPPLVPFLARVIDTVAPDSLFALRLPSAMVAAAVVVITGLLAREFGGGRGAQALAAGAMAIAAFTLGSCHLLSTSTFDLLGWTVLTYLIVRMLRSGNDRSWLAIGAVAGVGLLDSNLVAFLLAGVVAGVLIVGPRRTLLTPWPWIGGVIALVMWAPYLLWQARHGWPQFEISRAIAAGESGSSQPRSLFIPYQFGLVSPFLAPVWIAGLVALFRSPRLAWCRAIGWAYVLLTVVFIATGGKAYYIAGLFPVLLGAGAPCAVRWINERRTTARRVALGAAFVLSSGVIVITLPIVPVRSLHDTPVADANYDAGETVAWPTYVREIAAAFQPGQIILTSNYGEAGAVERFGQPFGLPEPFSGQTGYWYWGPPPDTADRVLAVGFDERELDASFAECELVGRLDNHLDVDNDEQDAPLWSCRGPSQRWDGLWPRFRES